MSSSSPSPSPPPEHHPMSTTVLTRANYGSIESVDKQPTIDSSSNVKNVAATNDKSPERQHTIESPMPTTTTTANRLSAENAVVDDDIIRSPVPAKSTKTTAAASRLLRRAFSMPRNPFRLSSRRLLKVNDGGGTNSSSLDEHDPQLTGNGVERHSNGSATSSSNGSYTRTEEVDAKLLNACRNGLEHAIGNEDQHQPTDDVGDNNKSQINAIKRRSQSWRKVILRLAHQMTAIGTKQSHSLTSAAFAGGRTGGQRVPPLSAVASGYLDTWPADQIPGVTGLKNHGNTCFMNAVLQCLSHTDILAEYFVLDQYKVDLKRRNKLTSRKFGTKGELTEQLALVLKALWTCKLESDWSTTVGFKAVVDRYGTQFRSAQQHDAQEFLFWLLDKVHEDLNTAPKRKYKTIKNTFGRPDAVLAAETLANHVRGNRSFVQAVFQAQFRSSLACPQCHRQSNTFDPFHCISVQLPQQHVQLPVYVTVRYAAQHPRQVRLGLSIAAGAPVSVLRAQLQTDTGIPAGRMVLVELADDIGFGRVLADAYTLDTAANLYCMETPAVQSITNGHSGGGGVAAASEAADRDARKCDGLLTVLVANARRTDTALQRFGTPFCVEIRRDVTYAELQKRLLKEMQHVLRPDVFAYAVQPADLFRMRLQDPSADSDAYMVPRVEHPLFMEMIDLALVVLASDAGPAHVKLLLEWREPERFFIDMTDDAVEHESVTLVRGAHQAQAESTDGNGSTLTLEQCLDHYTRAETLGAEDAWRCPHCQQYLPVVKTLGLWSLPEILVIHFKRFASHQDHHLTTGNGHSSVPLSNGLPRTAAKLTTSVTFPLTGFDMTPHLAQQQRLQTHNGHRKSSGLSGSSTMDNGNDSSRDQNLYDLYAVCYHQGETLETGHYTAACKNPYDLQWYRFDDQKVTAVPGGVRTASEIVNNEAYILFYQRRVAATGVERSGASTTVNGSLSTGLSTLGLSEHWVSRIAPVPPVSPLSSSISQGSIGLSFATAAEPDRVNAVEASIVEASAAELYAVVSIDEQASDSCNNCDADDVNTSAASTEIQFICDESEREPTSSMPEDVISQLPALTTNAISVTTTTLATSTYVEPQFAELCQHSAGTSGSEESPQPSPPMRLRSHPPINRGSLSFSEVFRRRESPLLNSMCVSRHSADHRSFLSEDVAAAAISTSTAAQLRNGGGGSNGGGSGSGSPFLLVDNRSASWDNSKRNGDKIQFN